MKRARKLPRKVFFTSLKAEIRRARMRAYLEKTREDYQRNVGEALKLGEGGHSSFDVPRTGLLKIFRPSLDKSPEIQVRNGLCVCKHPFNHPQLF